MIYGSVCSGIEAASVAWEPLGWRPSFFSEIEKFPRAVLSHHYPNVPLHGDFTTIKDGDYEPIDLLVGGTPCQSFSLAGLRKGLDDDRGNLSLQFLLLASRLRPRWLVWENVPGVLSSGGGRDFGSILGGMAELGYGFCYRVLDSQYIRTQRFPFAVPQRRRRVFVIGYLGDWRPAAAALLERKSMSGNTAPSKKAQENHSENLGGGFNFSGQSLNIRCGMEVSPTLDAGSAHYNRGVHIAYANDVSRCLNAGGCGRLDWETETILPFKSEDLNINVRKLSVTECERLQGFPDGYTLIPWRGKSAKNCPDGPRYKSLGNSMSINVMDFIGRRISIVQSIIDSGVSR